MKYFYKSLQLVLVVVVLMACKKLVNDSMDVVPVLKAPLSISVINDDDQLPVVGAKVIISRKISTKDDFAQIDTVRTDQQGQIKLELPYPNYLKIEVDTTYYHKGEQTLEFTTENGGSVTLHTTPKFGMAPLGITVTDKTDVALPGFALAIDSRAPEQTTWRSSGPENADATGKLMVSLPYPNEVRVSVGDTIKYFPDTVVTTLKNVRGSAVTLKAELKPLTVPVQITVLDKDNNAPLANVSIAVQQKLTGETAFKDIGLTGTTDKDGKLILNAPYSGEVRIYTTDDLYNFPAEVVTRMAYEKNRTVTLLSKALIPTAPVEVTVSDQLSGQILPGVSVKVSYKRTGQTIFTEVITTAANEEGKLNLSVPFSGEMKFEVLNDLYFADKAIVAQNIGAAAKTVSLQLTKGTPKYPEPNVASLQVTTLVLNNNIVLNKPNDAAIDKVGNIYITDQGNHRIIRVSKTGNTTILAGSGTAGNTDGVGTAAKFNSPWGLAIDDAGKILYVTDHLSHKIRKITIDPVTMVGTVSTIAGSGTAGVANGSGTAATFNRPSGITLDEVAGLLYVGDYNGGDVRKIELNNSMNVTTFNLTAIYSPASIALNAARNQVYVGAFGNGFSSTASQLIRIPSAGARVGLCAAAVDNFNDPAGIYVSAAGKVFISNSNAHMISQLISEAGSGQNGSSTFSFIAGSATYTNTTVNGTTGTPGYVDGSAVNARFTNPAGIEYNTYTGSFIIADQGNNKIRIMKSSTIQ